MGGSNGCGGGGNVMREADEAGGVGQDTTVAGDEDAEMGLGVAEALSDRLLDVVVTEVKKPRALPR